MPAAELGMRTLQSNSPPPPPATDECPTPPPSTHQHMHINISESAVLEVFQQKFTKLFKQWKKVEEETMSADCSENLEPTTLVTRLQEEFRLQLQFYLDNFRQMSNDEDRVRRLCLYFEGEAKCRFELLFKRMRDEEKKREGSSVIEISEPSELAATSSPEIIAEIVKSPMQEDDSSVSDVSERCVLAATPPSEILAEKVKRPGWSESEATTRSELGTSQPPEIIAEQVKSPTQKEGWNVSGVPERPELARTPSPEIVVEKENSIENDLVIVWERSPNGHSSQVSPQKHKRPVRTPLAKIDDDLVILKFGPGRPNLKVSRKPRNSKRKVLSSPVKICDLRQCKVVIFRDRNLDERAEILEMLRKSQVAEIQVNEIKSKMDISSQNEGVSGQTESNVVETSDFEFSGNENESILPRFITEDEVMDKDESESDRMTDQDQISDLYHPSSTASLLQSSISSAYESGSEYIYESDDDMDSLFSQYRPSPRQRACKDCPYKLRPSPSKPVRFLSY